MTLLRVEQALARVLEGVAPLEALSVRLDEAQGRVLAHGVVARLTQPPFDASAMDGFAIRATDAAKLPVTLHVVGQAAAGAGHHTPLAAGQAVRIFTGAPVPAGASAVVIQENAARDGDLITLTAPVSPGDHIRALGGDFRAGEPILTAGLNLNARALMIAAAAGHAALHVRRRPRVAILATGDELVPLGETPGPGQIVSSNPVGLAALVRAFGGDPILLGQAPDTIAAIAQRAASAAEADILVTTGGVSVGDHDQVQPALASLGMTLDFWKIAMRPGKPLMVGRLGGQRVLGLPGNPVSALVTARLFLVPLMRAMLGATTRDQPLFPRTMTGLEANGPRQHYMRAKLTAGDGGPFVTALHTQDSSFLSAFSAADGLIIRPPGAPAVAKGAHVPVLPLDF